jgi:hypothetical protein
MSERQAEVEAGVEAEVEAEQRVTHLELFFDLVFVFAITQLTAVLAEHPTLEGVAQVLLVFGVLTLAVADWRGRGHGVTAEGVSGGQEGDDDEQSRVLLQELESGPGRCRAQVRRRGARCAEDAGE